MDEMQGTRWFDEVEAHAKELPRFTQEEVVVLAQCVTLHSDTSPSALGSPVGPATRVKVPS